MLLHYVKIAWRNLLKYKTQTIVSMMGLAIGFTAFSFTMSWIRYELSYDSHNPDRDRIYRVVQVDTTKIEGLSNMVPDPLADYLPRAYPEIEAASFLFSSTQTLWINAGKDSIENVRTITADTSFFRVFYPEINLIFPQPLPSIAYVYTSSFDKKMNDFQLEKSSGFLGVVADQNTHSNVVFDQLRFVDYSSSNETYCPWCIGMGGAVYIRLRENVNADELIKKLTTISVDTDGRKLSFSFKIIPLSETHYTIPDQHANVKYTHLKIFALVAILVILSGLFNYIMLFVNRIKLRSRELALRKVNAASDYQLAGLLITEFLLLLLFSLLMGGVLTEWLFPHFLSLSQIEAPKAYFLAEAALYSVGIVAFSIIAITLPTLYFMQRSVRENIQPETMSHGGIKNQFTLTSIFTQLSISILLMFCTFVFLFQIYYLNHSDIGFNRHNVATISGLPMSKNELRSLPYIENAILFSPGFLPSLVTSGITLPADAGSPDESTISYEIYPIESPDFLEFFEIQLLQGRNLYSNETQSCLLNETASRRQGHETVIGKKLGSWTVVGVIADLKTNSPLLPTQPAIYTSGANENSYAYRFAEGKRLETEQALQKIIAEKSQSLHRPTFRYMDDEYSNYTKSERNLLKLLSMMTVTAILIAVFGVYSMITLACNQRRKEIAIRKVNGARMNEVLFLFFREYFIVTLTAYIVALPVGVYVMQRWLEQYTRRVSMEWWLFAGVLIVISVVVFFSIFFRVHKAASENPAVVIKSE